MKTLKEITQISGVELKIIFFDVERIMHRYNHYLGYSNGESLDSHINRYLEVQKFKPAKRKLVDKCLKLYFKQGEDISSPLNVRNLNVIRLYDNGSVCVVYKAGYRLSEVRFSAF